MLRAGEDPYAPAMPAKVRELYERLDAATDPRERAQIEEALAAHQA